VWKFTKWPASWGSEWWWWEWEWEWAILRQEQKWFNNLWLPLWEKTKQQFDNSPQPPSNEPIVLITIENDIRIEITMQFHSRSGRSMGTEQENFWGSHWQLNKQ
jgi:hypothetical protein